MGQPAMEQPVHQHTPDYQQQWFGQSQTHAHQPAGQQMSPDMDVLVQTASQLQNSRSYEIEHPLSSALNHGLQYAPAPYDPAGRHSAPIENYGQSFPEPDSQLLEGRSDEQDEVDSQVGASGPLKKGTKSSAANELEMRQLFHSNKHRTLPQVAKELHGNERGPQSERQRQVFAMLWYALFAQDVRFRTNMSCQDKSSLRKGQRVRPKRSCIRPLRDQMWHRESYRIESGFFRQACSRALPWSQDKTTWCAWGIQISLRQLQPERRPAGHHPSAEQSSGAELRGSWLQPEFQVSLPAADLRRC